MAETDPEDGSVTHTGTFNANPATMAAGSATLEQLDQPTIKELNEKGESLCEALREIASESPVPVTVTGEGSFFQIHFTGGPIERPADVPADPVPKRTLFMGMRVRNVFMAPRGMGNLSIPMGDEELSTFAEAFQPHSRTCRRPLTAPKSRL